MDTSILHGLIEREWLCDRAHDDVTARLLGLEGEKLGVGVVRSREDGVYCGEGVCAGFQEFLGDVHAGKAIIRGIGRSDETHREGDKRVTDCGVVRSGVPGRQEDEANSAKQQRSKTLAGEGEELIGIVDHRHYHDKERVIRKIDKEGPREKRNRVIDPEQGKVARRKERP